MPKHAESHAWHDFNTPHARLGRLPDVTPGPGTLAERIARILAAAIDAGTLRQGEKLPAAAPIAGRFTTSVDTARNAVRWLVQQGYAERQRGGATYVRGPVS